MTNLQIFAAMGAWLVATGIVCYLVFRFGYNLGWSERQKSMILPRNITKALGQRIDLDEQHGRHSAMDASKQF